MALVKRTAAGIFTESYEINSFVVDLESKTVSVRMTKYVTGESGIPVATDFVYYILDKVEKSTSYEEVEQKVMKRDAAGKIVTDSQGNPVMTTIKSPKETAVDTKINAYSELIQTVTSGEILYKEIQKALYASFVKYYLNGAEGFVIE